MGIRVGKDLGTTFSVVAGIDPNTGKPMAIKNSFGSAITPSVLCSERKTNKKLPIKMEPVFEDMSWTNLSLKGNMSGGEMMSFDIMLAIDLSGSMSGDPTRKAMKAIDDFVKQMDSNYTRIGIIVFADTTKVILQLTNNFEAVHNIISRLESVDVGICNDAEPFNSAYNVLNDSFMKKGSVKYIVVLTDGCWNNTSTAINAAKKCHNAGIEVMALGFGSADHSFLKKIASTDEFALITDLPDLGGCFFKIAQAIGKSSIGMRGL